MLKALCITQKTLTETTGYRTLSGGFYISFMWTSILFNFKYDLLHRFKGNVFMQLMLLLYFQLFKLNDASSVNNVSQSVLEWEAQPR